jgi:hypothetical protein
MKTERRHELQTNVLADRLARGADAMRPYGKIILGVVLLALLAVVVASFWSTRQRQRATQGWNEFFAGLMAGDESKLEKTAEEYSNTKVEDWAKLVQAEMELGQATDQLMADPPAAREKLSNAVSTYEGLKKSSNPLVQQRATFGLGQAYESRGELAKAREEYDALVKNWPDSPYTRTAKQRSQALDKQTTKQFYDWLAQYKPETPASKLPGVPGIGPDFNKGLDSEFPSSTSSRPGEISLPSFLDKPVDTSEKSPADETDGAKDATDTESATPASEAGNKGADSPPDAGAPASENPDASPAADIAGDKEGGAASDAANSTDASK